MEGRSPDSRLRPRKGGRPVMTLLSGGRELGILVP